MLSYSYAKDIVYFPRLIFLKTEAHINSTLDELMVIFDMPATCRTDDLNDFVAELEDITLWDA